MKKLIICIGLFFLYESETLAQELKRTQLSKEDREKGIKKKYHYASGRHHEVILKLFSTGKYRLEVYDLFTELFNEGSWTRKNGQLFLKDNIDKDNVPLVLEYSSTPDTITSFAVKEVRNLKGEYTGGSIVYINNDSTRCIPGMGLCINKYEKIDSIKFVFPNECRSNWIKVTEQNYQQIIPVLRTDFLMERYTYLRRDKYRIAGSYLKPIE